MCPDGVAVTRLVVPPLVLLGGLLLIVGIQAAGLAAGIECHIVLHVQKCRESTSMITLRRAIMHAVVLVPPGRSHGMS